MASKSPSPAKLESREDLHRTETQPKKEGLAPAPPTHADIAALAERASRRRPIAVSTHIEPDRYQGDQFLTITTLLFDDGTAWRNGTGEWRQVYELGDEEPRAST